MPFAPRGPPLYRLPFLPAMLYPLVDGHDIIAISVLA